MKDISLYDASASHVDKMEFRLTLPLLGHLTGTGIWTVPVWTSIATVLLFFLLARQIRDATGDTVAAALIVIGLAGTFFGAWGFHDFMFGDAVGLVLMLLAATCGSYPWLAALCFLPAAFVDERCITSFPLLVLYYWVRYSSAEQRSQRNRSILAIILSVAAWIALRLWIGRAFRLETGTSLIAGETALAHFTTFQTIPSLIGLYRASWIIPALALRRLIREQRWMLAVSMIFAFGCAVAPAFLVIDLNRSLCYAFMVFLISVDVLWRDSAAPKHYLAALMLVNILISPPTKSVFRLLAPEQKYAARNVFARVPLLVRFGEFAQRAGATTWRELPPR
jgi:hypothetical protein